ncbi:MAG: nuclear transport factor 2 family protein, partial [Sphingomonadales bacterium]|nr:nuclear transport factor 2 family protein [Sphingomonadales bacterium]
MQANDWFAIQNLLFQYPYALDRGDFDAVGQLFAEARVYSGGALLADRDPAAYARTFRDWVIVYPDGTPRSPTQRKSPETGQIGERNDAVFAR